MGLINVDSLINNSSFLSQTKTFMSALDSSFGNDSKVKPKYIYPNDIDRQYEANYMIIYIYDNNDNNISFQPISSQIAKSKIQKDLLTKLTDSISINVRDDIKAKLKDFKSNVEKWLKDSVSGVLGKDSSLAKKLDEWGLTNGNILKDNMLYRSVSSIADSIGLPKLIDINNTSSIINISVDKNKLNEFIEHLKGSSSARFNEPMAIGDFTLKTSIVLPLPEEGISYDSKIGISSSSTRTAQAVKNVVDAVLERGEQALQDAKNHDWFIRKVGSAIYGTGATIVAGGKQVVDEVSARGNEILYNILGEGGMALHQKETKKIVDPLLGFSYSMPDPRTFEYDFLMAPRNKDELYDIWNIIKTLKYYSHMQVVGGVKGTATTYYGKPARFKVKYYTAGNENVWLGKTKLMGLTGISTNIDTNNMGFIVNDFDQISGNPPKVIAMKLSFTELSFMTRNDVNEGY